MFGEMFDDLGQVQVGGVQACGAKQSWLASCRPALLVASSLWTRVSLGWLSL
jgi:hypothetical protein